MFKTIFKKFMLSLLLTVFAASMFSVRAFADLGYESANLLINPGFEEYVEDTSVMDANSWLKGALKRPVGWIGDINSWVLSNGDGVYRPADGKYFLCLLYRDGKVKASDYEKAKIYQDVDVNAYSAGTVFKLSGSLRCYDQSPHDQAVMYLNFLDASGKILASKSIAHRSPEYVRYEINLPKPSGAVKARVMLRANRFVGSDNDGYFDAFDLRATDGTQTYRKVVISGKKAAKAGESVQLSVTNGVTSEASSFIWRSEYESWATVDAKGKVTLTSAFNPEVGVTIYAQDIDGNVGSFTFGNGKKNTDIEPDVNSGQNNTDTGQNIGTVSVVKIAHKGNKAELKWGKYKGADYYLVHKYISDEKGWEVVGFAGKNRTSGVISNLKKNVEYRYKLTAEKRIEHGSITIATTDIIKIKLR